MVQYFLPNTTTYSLRIIFDASFIKDPEVAAVIEEDEWR